MHWYVRAHAWSVKRRRNCADNPRVTVLTPPPELDTSGAPRLSVVLAVASGLLLLLGVAAFGLIGASSMRPGSDWAGVGRDGSGWAGDPKAVESIAMPSAFNEGDSVECASGEGARCYLTSLGVKSTLVEVTQALGASTYNTVESRYGTAYTVCGQVDGTPTVGIVRAHIDNAILFAPGAWRIPKNPTFDGRLSVALIVAVTNTPACI